MDAPYRVETTHHTTQYGYTTTTYTICKTGEGELVHGTDLALMHKIIDLLNEDAHSAEGR